MFDRWLARFRDPLEVRLDAAGEVFYDEREDEISSARERAEALHAECEEALDELQAALKEMEEFEDREGRQRFEDVVENVVEDRQRLLEETTLPEEPADLYDELESVVDAFHRMTRKESAIMGRIDSEHKTAFRVLDRVEDRKERLGSFLDEQYQVMDRYGQLNDLSERRQELQEAHRQLEQELDSIDTVSPRKERKQLEDQLEDLQAGDTWEDYQSLQEEQDNAQKQRQNARQSIKTAMRKMDRGLKKLLYEEEHGDVQLPADTAVLEDIKDRDRDALMDRDPGAVESAVESAVAVMPDHLISDRQQEKFTDGAETLMDLSTLQEQIEELDSRINELDRAIEEHEAPQKERELERKIADLEQTMQDRAERREDLRQEIEDTAEQIEDIEEEIAVIYEDAFHRDVNVQ